VNAHRRVALACFAAGVLIGAIGIAAYALSTGGALTQPARVEVVNGVTSAVNATGTSIGIRDMGGHFVAGYSVSGAIWSRQSESWHDPIGGDSNRSCLIPLSSGQKLRLGVVNVPAGHAPGGPRVVWFQCLGGVYSANQLARASQAPSHRECCRGRACHLQRMPEWC
jgi:hypothetical protein